MQRRSGKKIIGGKHITVKVCEELKSWYLMQPKDIDKISADYGINNLNIEWLDNNGINTPYLITYV